MDLLTAAFEAAYELKLGIIVSEALDDTLRMTPSFPANAFRYPRVNR